LACISASSRGRRSDDEVHDWGARDDLAPLGLRHAARDGDPDLAAGLRLLLLELAHPAKLGIDLLRRLLADVAGVEDDEIGFGHLGGFGVALRRQHIRHAGRVIGVHLAAVGLDEDALVHVRPFSRAWLGCHPVRGAARRDATQTRDLVQDMAPSALWRERARDDTQTQFSNR
jgi:hypothetical protein